MNSFCVCGALRYYIYDAGMPEVFQNKKAAQSRLYH
jgi:hypothetical protein